MIQDCIYISAVTIENLQRNMRENTNKIDDIIELIYYNVG